MKDGKSLTDSGYPRTVREVTRGTKLEEAPVVFEGEDADVLAMSSVGRHVSSTPATLPPSAPPSLHRFGADLSYRI